MTDFESNVLAAMDKMAASLRLLTDVVPMGGGVAGRTVAQIQVHIDKARASVAPPPEEPVAEPAAYSSDPEAAGEHAA